MSERLRVVLVAGEPSGDLLGASLMRALRRAHGPGIVFSGVGGPAMAAEGFRTLFPISDIAVIGVVAAVKRLPVILRRVYQLVGTIVRAAPDILVIIDSPDFTHPVARRVARRLPALPIVNYVSPTVWAWRPGRAPRMRGYIAHVMALKPFEPAAHLRLGGPPCTYVGHPLTERMDDLRPRPGERLGIDADPLRLVVLPGSRRGEIARLLAPFGEAVRLFAGRIGRPLEVRLPAVDHLSAEIRAGTEGWPVRPEIVIGEAARHEAFRRAHLALAASGTVTLELALAGVPMVVAYRLARIENLLRFLITAKTIVLTNLVLEEHVVPEFVQDDCTPENLAAALVPLAADTADRRRQAEAFRRLPDIMEPGMPGTPSDRAAALVLQVHRERRV